MNYLYNKLKIKSYRAKEKGENELYIKREEIDRLLYRYKVVSETLLDLLESRDGSLKNLQAKQIAKNLYEDGIIGKEE